MFVAPIRLLDILELEIALRHIEPVIRRRLHVSAVFELDIVHHAIQAAFGWDDCHPHGFRIGGFEFAPIDEDSDTFAIDEAGTPLGAVARVGKSFEYHYDFADDWVHVITIARVVGQGRETLTCVDGARACPPEDCGGPHGYEQLLAALADEKHPEHARMSEWVGDEYEPEKFDRKATNRKLARLLKELLREE